VKYLDLSAPGSWRRGAEPPEGEGRFATRLCARDGAVIVSEGYEYLYTPSLDAWTHREVTLPRAMLDAPFLADAAIAETGTSAGIAGGGVVVLRSPAGEWTDTGVTAHHLLASGEGVVALDAGSQTYTEVAS
jgi:hypothetical protein